MRLDAPLPGDGELDPHAVICNLVIVVAVAPADFLVIGQPLIVRVPFTADVYHAPGCVIVG